MILVTVPSKPHRNIGIMVFASLVNACCGVILAFGIPRFLSVDDFGSWRTFLLYAGYAGLLHLGVVDGALIIWSRDRSGSPVRSVLGRTFRFVALEHLLIIALAASSFLLHVPPPIPALLMALAVFALLFNLVALLQIYHQTGFRFDSVAFGMSAPPTLFVLSFGVLAFGRISVRTLLIAYLATWAVTLVSLLWVAYRKAPRDPVTPHLAQPSAWRLGLTYIGAGWPIVLANTGFGLMQSADRVTVNLTRSIHDFAIYSLSQSTIYVPITILAAVSRVAFSWFARALAADRGSLYRSSTRLLALFWMLLLPYYFLVEFVVNRFLPRYTPGLPAGRILLLSVLFLSLIQIVQFNTYNLEGRQRQFFFGSLIAVAVAFATAWLGSQKIGTLTAVAWSQVLTAGLWWLGNEWFLRDRKLLPWRDILVVLATFALATAGLYLGSPRDMPALLKPVTYYGFAVITVLLLYRTEMRAGWQAAKLQLKLRGSR